MGTKSNASEITKEDHELIVDVRAEWAPPGVRAVKVGMGLALVTAVAVAVLVALLACGPANADRDPKTGQPAYVKDSIIQIMEHRWQRVDGRYVSITVFVDSMHGRMYLMTCGAQGCGVVELREREREQVQVIAKEQSK